MESEYLTEMREKLVANFLDTLILLRMKNGSLTSNDIISYIHRRFDVLVSLGTVYSCLHRLEKDELITAEWGSKERVYRRTEKGKEIAETLSGIRDKILGTVVDLFIN